MFIKKGLKVMNSSSLGINSMVYINDSLCTYYKMLWGKCTKLLLIKYSHPFWVRKCTIKLKTVENGWVYTVTSRNDLVELFPDNEVLADDVYEARFFLKVMLHLCYKYVPWVYYFSSLFQVICVELTLNNALFSHFYFYL